jgi:hypothetical protein
MARPERNNIDSGIAAWDGDVDRNFDIILNSPFPIVAVADLATLTSTFAASSYDDCLALTEDDSRLYISNGTTWELYDRQSALVADSTAATVSEMATDFNELLDALKASGLMASS